MAYRNRLAILFGIFMVLATSSVRAGEASANISLASDYAFRGISQTNENPAIQGGFDLTADSGLYIGVWGSNVNFDGGIELDVYAGYTGHFTDTVSFDLGLLRYEYPDDQQAGPSCDLVTLKICESSFSEVYGSVTISDLTIGINYSSDYFYNSDAATYFYINYSLGLPAEYGIDFHFGSQAINFNDRFGTPDYADYSVALTKSAMELDFSLTWIDTDLSQDQCFGGARLCESRVVFAIGKSL